MFFGEYKPDLPDFENEITVAKNVLPFAKSYKSVGSLQILSDALTAYCQGAFSCKDNAGTVYNFAGDATTLYKVVSQVWTSVNLSATGTDIAFTASATIGSTSTDLSVFADTQTIEVTGSASNNTNHTVSGSPTSTSMTTSGSPAVVNESAGASVTLRRLYATPSEGAWEFVQWGNNVIATNYADPVQVLSLGASTEFDDLAGSPPKAKHIGVMSEFVVLGNIPSYPNRVQWSGIGDSTYWTAGTRLSDYQDLQEGGAVQKIIGSQYGGFVLMESAIYQFTFDPVSAFRIDLISANIGTPFENSVIRHGGGVFFLGNDSFYFFQSGEATQISVNRVSKTFFADLDQSYPHRVIGAIDPINSIVFWAYPGAGNVAGEPNRIVCYNYSADRWAMPIEVNTQWIFNGLGEGVTLDGLDSLYASIDAMEVSLDSRVWKGGALVLMAFDTDNKVCSFTGSAMAPTIETGEIAVNSGGTSLVSGVRPLFDGDATATAQVGSLTASNSAVTWTSVASQNSQTGLCDVRSVGRYHRFRLLLSGEYNHFYGFDLEAKGTGRK